jgi:hypothetical protein
MLTTLFPDREDKNQMFQLLKKKYFFLLLPLFFTQAALSQETIKTDTTGYKTAVAGIQYKRSAWHQFLWGKNYRKEWTTPVKLPVLMLDTARGGLTPFKEGGGHQSKSLQLKNPKGEIYKLHSVDKTLGKVLPEAYKNTFLESLANDEVSMSFPYPATSVTLMEQYAKIYHTKPQYVYLPKQAALDTFNVKFGEDVYLFEDKPTDDRISANNIGNFTEYDDTEDVLEDLYKDNDNQIDQKTFVKARLFDMMVGNWDRHEDQWAWGTKEDSVQKLFEAVPLDKDQVYFKHDGLLLNLALGASGMTYMQNFDDKIKNVRTLNYEQRGIDRLFTNQLTGDDWKSIAIDLQRSLPDSVISLSVKRMPPEIFAISGNAIISKLKARRDGLVDIATTYYRFLAEEVEIVGSKNTEYFEVKRLNDSITAVKIYSLDKDGIKNESPFYSRDFKNSETREIRLFGLSGKDTYSLEGNVNNNIKVRLIGGIDKDTYTSNYLFSGSKNKIEIYDNHDNVFNIRGETKLHLSEDTTINKYVYKSFLYDTRGIKPSIFYSNEDRVYVGVKYTSIHHEWRKLPFAFKQDAGVNYSLTQKAFNFNYDALFPQLIGKWSLPLKLNYDLIRWTNFFGLGNETILVNRDRPFNRIRSREFLGTIDLKNMIGKSTVEFGGFFQTYSVINDTGHFISSIASSQPEILQAHSYIGPQFKYSIVNLSDSVAPTSGYNFAVHASYSKGIQKNTGSFASYSAALQFYVPLIPRFSLAIYSGVSTVSGDPQLYQYPAIGGAKDMRGFRLDRFRGKTALYNSNELRYTSNVKSYLFNGKAGLLAFYDQGRVWQPAESSDTWHHGYGGGILLSPFNRILTSLTYGISDEEKVIQIRLGKLF